MQGLKVVTNIQLHLIIVTRNTGLELSDLLNFQEKLKSGFLGENSQLLILANLLKSATK